MQRANRRRVSVDWGSCFAGCLGGGGSSRRRRRQQRYGPSDEASGLSSLDQDPPLPDALPAGLHELDSSSMPPLPPQQRKQAEQQQQQQGAESYPSWAEVAALVPGPPPVGGTDRASQRRNRFVRSRTTESMLVSSGGGPGTGVSAGGGGLDRDGSGHHGSSAGTPHALSPSASLQLQMSGTAPPVLTTKGMSLQHTSQDAEKLMIVFLQRMMVLGTDFRTDLDLLLRKAALPGGGLVPRAVLLDFLADSGVSLGDGKIAALCTFYTNLDDPDLVDLGKLLKDMDHATIKRFMAARHVSQKSIASKASSNANSKKGGMKAVDRLKILELVSISLTNDKSFSGKVLNLSTVSHITDVLAALDLDEVHVPCGINAKYVSAPRRAPKDIEMQVPVWSLRAMHMRKKERSRVEPELRKLGAKGRERRRKLMLERSQEQQQRIVADALVMAAKAVVNQDEEHSLQRALERGQFVDAMNAAITRALGSDQDNDEEEEEEEEEPVAQQANATLAARDGSRHGSEALEGGRSSAASSTAVDGGQAEGAAVRSNNIAMRFLERLGSGAGGRGLGLGLSLPDLQSLPFVGQASAASTAGPARRHSTVASQRVSRAASLTSERRSSNAHASADPTVLDRQGSDSMLRSLVQPWKLAGQSVVAKFHSVTHQGDFHSQRTSSSAGILPPQALTHESRGQSMSVTFHSALGRALALPSNLLKGSSHGGLSRQEAASCPIAVHTDGDAASPSSPRSAASAAHPSSPRPLLPSALGKALRLPSAIFKGGAHSAGDTWNQAPCSPTAPPSLRGLKPAEPALITSLPSSPRLHSAQLHLQVKAPSPP